MSYDSTADTVKHIQRVQQLLLSVGVNLMKRADSHDQSKLSDIEKEAYDEETPKLRETTYRTPEYFAAFEPMKEAITHHYQHNSHHPEHYANGIDGMSLLDLIEMLVDWKAASERHADGDFLASIEFNQKRFGYTDQMKSVLLNTARELELS